MEVDEPIKAEAGPSSELLTSTSTTTITNGSNLEELEVIEGAEVVEAVEGEEEKVEGEEDVKEDVEMVEELPEGASEVIYINNLNEKIKIDGKFRSNSFLYVTTNSIKLT